MKNCETCGVAIEIELGDGKVMRFALHTDEFCKAMARDRIRMLESDFRRRSSEDRLIRYEATEMARKLDAIESLCKATTNGQLDLADVIEDMHSILHPPLRTKEEQAAINLERLRLASLLEVKPLHHSTVPQPGFCSTCGAGPLHASESDDIGRCATCAQRASGPVSVSRGDLYHSQGIAVATILSETPLARPCPICGSPIGKPCIASPNPEYPLVNLDGCVCHEARAVTPVITE